MFSSLSGFLSDDAKLAGVISMGFGQFDKDHSGFVDKKEATAAAATVLKLVGVQEPPQSAIDAVFAKVAGTDGNLSKQEFTELVKQLLHHLHKSGGQAKPAK